MSVIFSRAPLRISLGGGGTDLPSYYREHGGFLVAGAIDKYIYMLTHTVFQRRYRMKYSETEEVDEIAEIQHPILRETLAAPLARQPARDRLGRRRAGGHRHGLLRVRSPSRCSRASRTRGAPRSRQGALAEAACEIEIDVLSEPCGKQDPYVAAHGGICAYTFEPDGSVDGRAARARARDAARAARPAAAVLHRRGARAPRPCSTDQDERTQDGRRRDAREPPPDQGDRASSSRELLVAGDLFAYAELMHEHWQNKRERSPGMATERDRRPLHAGAPQRRRSAASSSAPAAAASCSSTRATRRTRARRWPRPARPSCRSTSSSSGALLDRVRMSRARAAVGIVGCGLIGRQASRRRCGASDELVGAIDPVAERARCAGRRARRPGVRRPRRAARARARRRDRRDHPRPAGAAGRAGARRRARTCWSRSRRARDSARSSG